MTLLPLTLLSSSILVVFFLTIFDGPSVFVEGVLAALQSSAASHVLPSVGAAGPSGAGRSLMNSSAAGANALPFPQNHHHHGNHQHQQKQQLKTTAVHATLHHNHPHRPKFTHSRSLPNLASGIQLTAAASALHHHHHRHNHHNKSRLGSPINALPSESESNAFTPVLPARHPHSDLFYAEKERKLYRLEVETSFEEPVVILKSDKAQYPDALFEAAEMFAHKQKGLQQSYTIFDLETVVDKYAEWTRELPRVKPYYAVKSNSDPMILKTLSLLGAYFDCASEGEIEEILNGKLATPDQIIYANPIKTPSYIGTAKERKVRRMTFDCVEELEKVKRVYPEAELVLRIIADDIDAHVSFGEKFGAEPAMSKQLLEQAKKLGLNVVGVSFHVGTGCKNPEIFHEAISSAKELFLHGDSLGYKMNLLDIGGGFPGMDTAELTFSMIAKEIRSALDEHFSESAPETRDVQVIAEPGRFFSSLCVSSYTAIIGKRKVPVSDIIKEGEAAGGDQHPNGFRYTINDGVYGVFSSRPQRLVKGTPFLVTSKKYDPETTYPTNVWGPTCDSVDYVEAHMLPELEIGDWLYYRNMGAYTTVTASTFNGFPVTQKYFTISEGTWRSLVGENKENLEEVVDHQEHHHGHQDGA